MLARKLLFLLPFWGVMALAAPAFAQDGDEDDAPAADETTEDATPCDPETDPACVPPCDPEVDEDCEPLPAVVDYEQELVTVEGDVGQLKERVFKSKATLELLRELLIEGATMGSRIVVWHINQLGGSYSLEEIQYFLDGKNVYSSGENVGDMREAKVAEQAVPPGSHSLQVHMVLRGRGLGVFSYLKAYSFKVQSSYSFAVEDGKLAVVRVITDEKGGPFVDFVDRPSVRYEERSETLRNE